MMEKRGPGERKIGTMRYRHSARFLLYFALLSLPIQVLATVDFVASPLSSRAKNIRLLEASDTRVMLPLGYARDPSRPATMVLRPGTVQSHVYSKRGVDGKRGAIELALMQGVTSGFEFALIALTESVELEADLLKIGRRLEQLLRASEKSQRSQPDLGYEMVRLGNIEADRALAVLLYVS